MDAAYSMRTSEVYAKHLDVIELPLRLRRIKPSFLLALCAVLSTWGDQERYLNISTPRYLGVLTSLRI